MALPIASYWHFKIGKNVVVTSVHKENQHDFSLFSAYGKDYGGKAFTTWVFINSSFDKTWVIEINAKSLNYFEIFHFFF